mmetsp:Transcript_86458/g.231668  ORF Transcript_86458/g.231668 Transcript_86458/m.231668 type:complete len:279 (-) Transcript_86458:181-1017(-)
MASSSPGLQHRTESKNSASKSTSAGGGHIGSWASVHLASWPNALRRSVNTTSKRSLHHRSKVSGSSGGKLEAPVPMERATNPPSMSLGGTSTTKLVGLQRQQLTQLPNTHDSSPFHLDLDAHRQDRCARPQRRAKYTACDFVVDPLADLKLSVSVVQLPMVFQSLTRTFKQIHYRFHLQTQRQRLDVPLWVGRRPFWHWQQRLLTKRVWLNDIATEAVVKGSAGRDQSVVLLTWGPQLCGFNLQVFLGILIEARHAVRNSGFDQVSHCLNAGSEPLCF